MSILWYGHWQLKKSHVISSGLGPDIGDYQVRIYVHRESGTDNLAHVYLDTDCNADFSDIRFYDPVNDVFLPHYLEYVNGVIANFWVRFPLIPVAGCTIEIVYGYPLAVSASNGFATFPLFDDFYNSTMNTDRWQQCGSKPLPTFGNDVCNIDTANDGVRSIASFGAGHSIRFRANFQSGASSLSVSFCNSPTGYTVPSGYAFWGIRVYGGGTFAMDIKQMFSPYYDEAQIVPGGAIGEYRLYEFERREGYRDWGFRVNEVGKAGGGGFYVTADLPILIESNNVGINLLVDYIFVRKTLDIPVEHGTWGSKTDIITWDEMDKYYMNETIKVGDDSKSAAMTICEEIIRLTDTAFRAMHIKIFHEIVKVGDSSTGFLVYLARELIRIGNLAAGAFIAHETVLVHNGDNPDCQGCDEYGIGHSNDDIDEYGNPIFGQLKAVGTYILKKIHYKVDTNCVVVPQVAICNEEILVYNEGKEDT